MMVGVQMGVVWGAGKTITMDKATVMDGDTLVCCMKVMLPLLKAVSANPGLNDLLLNYPIAANIKYSCTITLLVGTQVEKVPSALF